ncbi:phosphate ABC transporter substrate-binding protein PstS [Parachitinimonas caeni]|uniref:Phosphate-binding protein PstS n=1 Tax=Parachitinimonas caeni TaxID=3031301 RepID=A0ABT7E0B7_9NEIS|nr:phosphate ABC transporter substrate-binding protein PstS [Parachitinimonas caeni]MDK2124793.1 phosphate ABC transporter substrate-binding protein PstS [Parachitinimonas caeni]
MFKLISPVVKQISGCVLVAGLSSQVWAADITGAGATFPYPIYAKWADIYKTKTGVGMNYQSIGSGGGIKQIKAKTVDFGASDKPLTVEELNKEGLVQFPAVIGGVVPIIEVPGIEPGKLVLTGGLLADIFLGKITKWNAPEIAAKNPGLKLPEMAITVVHRSDGSGTTFLFTNYLSKVSVDWKQKVGEEASVQWPVGIGGKGNEGVAAYVQKVKGSIGYVEYAYAKKNKIPHAALTNADGRSVQPDDVTFKAAAASADWKKAPGFNLILTNQPGSDSWPITGASFILMHKNQEKPAQGVEVLKFFDWAYSNGSKEATDMDYVPLPDALAQLIRAAWKSQITDGKAAIWK